MKQKLFSKSLTSFFALILSISTLAIFSGCDEDQNNPLSPTATSYLSVTHSSPNAPNVDIYFGSSLVASDVPYMNTLQYRSVTGNSVVDLKINVAGTSTTVIDTALYCQDGKSYSVFAYDSVSKIKPLVLTDDLTSPGSTNAKVRFIHLSPNGPTVDVGVTGKSVWFPFYSFSQYSNFRAVTGGTYTDLNVFLAGTTSLIYSRPNVTFTAGKIYTIVADGFAGSSFGISIYPNN